MTEDRRIELEVVVAGTPEEVWEAIATGPGISSWYVPHQVEERAGGAALASFGSGPEMQIPGRVAAWEPPQRIVFDGGEGVAGLAFEWLVAARDGASCIVRLVNSGFGTGEQWDAQYDAMTEGWKLFLRNLQLHCEHFRGQRATSALPMAMWAGSLDDVWSSLLSTTGIGGEPAPGAQLTVAPDGAPPFAGTVADRGVRNLALLVDAPAPGTAIVAVEAMAGGAPIAGVSVWLYLYGPGSAELAERHDAGWRAWLARRAPSDGAS